MVAAFTSLRRTWGFLYVLGGGSERTGIGSASGSTALWVIVGSIFIDCRSVSSTDGSIALPCFDLSASLYTPPVYEADKMAYHMHIANTPIAC